ncbi:MAG: hypothetical protein EBR48_04165, partial [bacterium]|nr:hypothetical protein [Candidatus Aquidulcis frankliniae]
MAIKWFFLPRSTLNFSGTDDDRVATFDKRQQFFHLLCGAAVERKAIEASEQAARVVNFCCITTQSRLAVFQLPAELGGFAIAEASKRAGIDPIEV